MSSPWNWVVLVAACCIYFVVALLKTAFRGLSRVEAGSIAQRSPRGEFLRKTLHHRTPLWYSLQLASVVCVTAVATLVTSIATVRGLEDWTAVATGIVATLVAALVLEHAVPPILAHDREEWIVESLLGPMRWMHLLFAPLSIPLSRWADRIGYGDQLPGDESPAEEADPEDVDAYIEIGEHEGILEEREKILVRGVVEFGDAILREVMTPRTDVVAVPVGISIRELRQHMAAAMHTRLPVYDGALDTVLGIVHLKDLVQALEEGRADEKVEAILRPAYHAPETMKVHDLLRLFQARRITMAIVVDEYGGTAGIVTTEDLIEEIVGEIQDEHETAEDWVVRQGDETWVVDGRTDLDELEELLGLDLAAEDVETVGGLVFSRLGHLPVAGETLDIERHRITVIESDEKRVHRVRVEPAPVGDLAAGEGVPDGPEEPESG